jgi:hypothetical protein
MSASILSIPSLPSPDQPVLSTSISQTILNYLPATVPFPTTLLALPVELLPTEI